MLSYWNPTVFSSIHTALPFNEGEKLNDLAERSSPYFTLSASGLLKRTTMGSPLAMTPEV